MFALQDSELLPKNQVLQQEAAAPPENAKKQCESDSNEPKQGTLISRIACAKQKPVLLIAKAGRLLANDSLWLQGKVLIARLNFGEVLHSRAGTSEALVG